MDWNESSIKLFVDDQLLNEIKTDKTFNPGNTEIKNTFMEKQLSLLLPCLASVVTTTMPLEKQNINATQLKNHGKLDPISCFWADTISCLIPT
jgi:hypothetical protein